MDTEGSITRKHLRNCLSLTRCFLLKKKLVTPSNSPITMSTHDSTKSRLDELYQPIRFAK